MATEQEMTVFIQANCSADLAFLLSDIKLPLEIQFKVTKNGVNTGLGSDQRHGAGEARLPPGQLLCQEWGFGEKCTLRICSAGKECILIM